MLRRTSEPLALSEASLLALRPALNAPVLNVDFLPVGPARAAIVVFAEEYGGIGLALGIRSNEGGQIVVFQNQQSIDDQVPLAEAIEPALSLAERLGFLFDEDMVGSGGQGRAQATALWGRLMGEVEMPPAPVAAPPLPAATESILDLSQELDPLDSFDDGEGSDDELMLDDVALEDQTLIRLEVEAGAPEETLETDPASGPLAEVTEPVAPAPAPAPTQAAAPVPAAAPVAAAAPETLPATRLSKFRQAAGPGEEEAERADAGSELGRIPIVRVRRGREGSRRIPYLARLLSSF